jgi:hypothetical protein
VSGPCLVCGAGDGPVCGTDRQRIADQLADLPRKIAALGLLLQPTSSTATDRVTISHGSGSPTPARLDVLSLVGPGAVSVTAMLHPQIQHWHTTRSVTVHTTRGGRPVVEQRNLVEWHQEIALDAAGRPILVADDDQIGTLPPAEWLDSWVKAWRVRLGHTVPPRTRRPRPGELTVDQAEAAMLASTSPATRAIVTAWRADAAAAVAGRRDGRDTAADDHRDRFTAAPNRGASIVADVGYLLAWLDLACQDTGGGIADLAGELRALSAELSRVLGEHQDLQWLGRCPARIVDSDVPDRERLCGAGLWHDPYNAAYDGEGQPIGVRVECPRCRSHWGPGRKEMLHLAGEIRRRWPIDRRRRYTDADRARTSPPRCPDCSWLTTVVWRDVTGTGDERRTWRPEQLACANNCDLRGVL